ncbi:unnamed protein product [Ilex paraguariensis]|uniref:Uncharacterized protein n=1 Tax=Ilex paraguariensis TaxID=185542 RepID=A0ABC8SF78_9AQUA
MFFDGSPRKREDRADKRKAKSTGKSQAAATITLRPLIQELLIEQLAILVLFWEGIDGRNRKLATKSLTFPGRRTNLSLFGLLGNGILGTSTFGQLSLCEGFGLLPSFESQEMIQSRTGPDYSVEELIQDCLLVSEAIDQNANSEMQTHLCPSINGASRGMSSFKQDELAPFSER